VRAVAKRRERLARVDQEAALAQACDLGRRQFNLVTGPIRSDCAAIDGPPLQSMVDDELFALRNIDRAPARDNTARDLLCDDSLAAALVLARVLLAHDFLSVLMARRNAGARISPINDQV
jgi:hypothetical protein